MWRQLSYFYYSWCIKACDHIFLDTREELGHLPSASKVLWPFSFVTVTYYCVTNCPPNQQPKITTIIYLLKILQTGGAQSGSLFLLHVVSAGQTHVFAVSWCCDWVWSIQDGLNTYVSHLICDGWNKWVLVWPLFLQTGLLSSRLSLFTWLAVHEDAGLGFLVWHLVTAREQKV